MKYRMFGQAVSKHDCFGLCNVLVAYDPQVIMMLFVLKGSKYSVGCLQLETIKIVKNVKF